MSFHFTSRVHRDEKRPLEETLDSPSKKYVRDNLSMAADDVVEGDILCTVGSGYLHIEVTGTFDKPQPALPPDRDIIEDPDEIRRTSTHRIGADIRMIHFRCETKGDPVTLSKITSRFSADGKSVVDER